MALDKNYFDDKLKEKPWRDLAFRAVVWFCISGLAAYFALRGGLTPLSFAERTAKSVGPIANFVGALAVWLVLPALALKDLEFFDPDKWGQVSRRGRLGGIVRRLSGDLLLWTLGAFSALLSAMTVAIVMTGVSESEQAAVGRAVAKLLGLVAITALLTVWVRRAGPSPLSKMVSGVRGALALYCAWVVVAGVLVLRAG